MYAVVKIAGHQHKVAIGDTITVDRLNSQPGEKVEYPALLVVNGDTVAVGPIAQKTMVTAHVVEQGQGEKIHIHRYRGKSRHRRHIGFRAQLTTLKIAAIGAERNTEKQNAPEPAAKKPRKTASTAKVSAV